jgi:hypothetical protein
MAYFEITKKESTFHLWYEYHYLLKLLQTKYPENNLIMIDRNNNFLWNQSIVNNDIYGKLEFKIPKNIVDNYTLKELKKINLNIVSPEEFLKVDNLSIPLFFETCYGMSPDIEIVKFIANPKFKFAVIKSSFLSCNLFRLTIKEYDSSKQSR